MSAITQLVAGVPVSDLDASTDWYTRFFGRPPDFLVNAIAVAEPPAGFELER